MSKIDSKNCETVRTGLQLPKEGSVKVSPKIVHKAYHQNIHGLTTHERLRKSPIFCKLAPNCPKRMYYRNYETVCTAPPTPYSGFL